MDAGSARPNSEPRPRPQPLNRSLKCELLGTRSSHLQVVLSQLAHRFEDRGWTLGLPEFDVPIPVGLGERHEALKDLALH